MEEQFRGARKTNVNCGTSGNGSGINEAIENGYTDITISGICRENLNYTIWRDPASDGYRPSGKLAPRYLKISGESSNSKIVDASSNSQNTISVSSNTTLFLENITISGGKYAVTASRNSNLLISNITVENFSERGLQVDDSSYLGVDEGELTIKGAAGADRGIHLATGSSGWIENMTVSGVKYGLYMFKSGVFMNGTIVNGAERGFVLDLGTQLTIYGEDKPVNITNSIKSGVTVWGKSHLTLSDSTSLNISGGENGIEIGEFSSAISGGEIVIKETSDNAIRITGGGISNWKGTISIMNSNGNDAINADQAQLNLQNIEISDNLFIAGLSFYRSTGDFNNLNFNEAKIGMRQSNINISNSNVTG